MKRFNYKIIHLFVVLLIGGYTFSCANKQSRTSVSPKDPVFQKNGEVLIYRGDSLMARFDTEIADTPYKRETGLMYRKQMKDNESMYFVFPGEQLRYFYMKNTYIPLDIIFIDGRHKIVSIVRNAKPLDETTLGSAKPARYVLEIKAGLADRLGFREGDRVELKK